MISRIANKIQRRNKDNRGAAMVMAIVAIAFIGMLVAMVLYMSYCNYLMKDTDKIAKDNFYSAEHALDVINAGLQHDISESMSIAYVKTMNNSSGQTPDDMTVDFEAYYIDELKKKIQAVDALGTPDPTKWNLSYLTQMWTNSGVTVAATAGNYGANLTAISGNNALTVTGNKHITLSNLQIVYTDDRGFVSIITTDIRLKVPDLNFAQAASKMNLERFALIANDALINDTSNTDPAPSTVSGRIGSDVKISGSVFGGYEGIEIANQKKIEFVINTSDVGAATPPTYDVITNTVNITNTSASQGMVADATYTINARNINLYGGRLALDGDVYIGDDLDVAGRESRVALKGNYRGYGNTYGDSDGSSSILINGADAILDFSELKELNLSGHAYVGAKKYDADEDRLAYGMEMDKADLTSDKIADPDKYEERFSTVSGNGTYQPGVDTVPKNEMDVMTGESLSVKANQLLYMVPTDCIGYIAGTDEQIIKKNPMTYEEYKKLVNTEKADENNVMQKVYEPVRLAYLWNRLGGVAYTNDYKAVYRRVNGTVLVYLYLDFGSNDMMANAFYKAYYDYDKSGVESYVKSYIKDMEWNSDLLANNNAKLSLAGNAFYLNNQGEVVFVDDSLEDSNKFYDMMEAQELYTAIYESLMHSLSADYQNLSSAQQTSEIFEYFVDEVKLAAVSDKDFTDGSIHAKIKDGDVVYPANCEANTNLIVATGNVYLMDDFEGLVMAGQKIYIGNGCDKIDYNPTKVVQAMKTKYTDVGGNEIYAYEVFGANGTVSYGVATAGGASDDVVGLHELITYENWKKE